MHKAPANEVVRGALNVTYRLHARGAGRAEPGRRQLHPPLSREGIRVWGARTLAAAASEWRYLNVRRLFNMIEESIAESTRWIVFEPNDRTLWKSIRRDVTAFLTSLWRDGALMGRTPEEAFFVKCDEETNPPDVIDDGQVVTLDRHRAGQAGRVHHLPHQPVSGGAEVEAQGGSLMRHGATSIPIAPITSSSIIQGVTEGHFTECSGLGVKVEAIKYREGGNNQVVRRIPGRVEYADVTLRYGLTTSHELWDWFMTAVQGQVQRKNVSILMLDPDGATEVMRWNLINAWPSEWHGAMLDAMSREVAIEA